MSEYIKKMQDEFIKDILASLEKSRIPWHMPWGKEIAIPYNSISNKSYQGTNRLQLLMKSNLYHYDDPRWMTFKQANEAGYKIKKGSSGATVFHYSMFNNETKKGVTPQEYAMLSSQEKKKVKQVMKSYKVFNGTQMTGIAPLTKETRKAVVFENEKAAAFASNLFKNMELKFEETGLKAAYLPDQDKIIMPDKKLFIDEPQYYGILFHEVGHASGHTTRMNRELNTDHHSKSYAIEELRAELGSAFLSMELGQHLSKEHMGNHKSYCQSWYTQIKDHPEVMFTAIKDAQDIKNYLLEKGEYQAIYKMADQEEVMLHGHDVHVNEKRALIVNVFGGPGAGKTTAALELTCLLKKQGVNAEFVGEYAKDLIYDDQENLLDGSWDNENAMLDEKVHQIERLVHKADVIVSDAPILQSGIYSKERKEEVLKKSLEISSRYPNLNVFLNRGNHFSTIGSQNYEESILIDRAILNQLKADEIKFIKMDPEHFENVLEQINEQRQLAELNVYERLQIEPAEDLEEKEIEEKEKVSLDTIKNSVGILDYARNKLGLSAVKQSKGLWRLEEYDSCIIYPNNTFYRFSRNRGGSIIDFIKEMEQEDTKGAIEKMEEYYYENLPSVAFDTHQRKQVENRDVKDIECPDKALNNNTVIKYLHEERGLSYEIIQDYLDRNVLYQDDKKNCVFLGRYKNTVAYAQKRSTTGSYKGDVLGSFKAVGVFIDHNSDTIIVNEAVIDQMSYRQLIGMGEKDYDYLACCGAANAQNAIKFHMLKRGEAQRIKNIILALDHDEAGEENTLKTIEYIKANFPDVKTVVHIPEGNDFNDDLKKLQEGTQEVSYDASYDFTQEEVEYEQAMMMEVEMEA
ncbi:MAG: zincin-like metallopeptidase domain-containing protein [Erysipelotrichaceae bacterium]